MALINYRGTTFVRAFFLYALVAALAATFAIEIRLQLENKDSKLFKIIAPLTPESGISHLHKLIAATLITFGTSVIIYHLMYIIFGWGGGMVLDKNRIGKIKYM